MIKSHYRTVSQWRFWAIIFRKVDKRIKNIHFFVRFVHIYVVHVMNDNE